MTVLPTCLLLLAAAALVPVPLVHASAGDRSVVFQQCVSQLEQRLCVSPPRPTPNILGDLGRLPGKLVGIMTYWRCSDTARYECMHAITDRLLADRKPVQQYYGKWPFWRVGGMQEPASVLFSVLNGYAHWRGAQEMRRRIPDGHPLKGYYLTSAYVSMNAWIWSAVFHTRDLSITEKFDYFSAAATILYAFYAAVVRLFHLYPSSGPFSPLPSSQHAHTSHLLGNPWLIVWTLFCMLAYMSHVAYLSALPRFDYSYNILANTIIGLSHNLLWLLYALPSRTFFNIKLNFLRRFPGQPRSYRPPYASRAAYAVGATMLAMSLELLDFAPWRRVLDAHALWHLATIPIAFLWYDFLVRDVVDQGWKDVRS